MMKTFTRLNLIFYQSNAAAPLLDLLSISAGVHKAAFLLFFLVVSLTRKRHTIKTGNAV